MHAHRIVEQFREAPPGFLFRKVERAGLDDCVPAAYRQRLRGPPALQPQRRAFAPPQLPRVGEHRLVGMLHDAGGQKIIGARQVQTAAKAGQTE